MKATLVLTVVGCVIRGGEAFLGKPLLLSSQQSAIELFPVHDTRYAYEAVKGKRTRPPVVCMVSEASAEYTKAQLAKVEQEYEAKRKAEMLAQTKQAAARGDASVTPLADLDLIPYINGEGMITDSQAQGAKASAYAVYDESKTLQYVGVSRGVQQSLRLHLARCPSETYYFKVQHISRPSRSLLEIVKTAWIEENGSVPKGNDEGEAQAVWENPMNVIPLFTDEDKALVEGEKEKGREDSGIKTIARRFEAEKVKILEARGIKESLRFDPKLKGKGLLDLHMPKPKNSVPK